MAAFVTYFLKSLIFKTFSCPPTYLIFDLCSGMLSGLVSITASCNNVSHWSALVIGAIGGFIYIFACVLMIKFKIDDPVEAS